MGPFVGVVEIVCGTLLLVGLLARLDTIPLLVDICVAWYSTKIGTLAKNGTGEYLNRPRIRRGLKINSVGVGRNEFAGGIIDW
jgi:uncharacterized membrane protein YphA (DoxX/SURF4 family)